MTNQFICPKCRSYLNVADNLVFSVVSGDDKKGLILLHPEIGNYSVKTNPNFTVEQGKKYEFFCPVCHTELASDVNENLSKVHMIDPENNEYEVHFSKVAGEKSTYTLIGESVNMYGEDYGNYVDFINLSHVK